MNKYGTYIQKLMTIVLDKEQDEFVKQMAWDELKRLGEGVKEFLIKNLKDDFEEKKKTEKILLQEAQDGKKKENESVAGE
tara:strand:+ start:306 stop:545 length:240 start_codon:yes stop_codon:yes gene_type:complete